MAKNLLIVESPAKAATINKYLGSDFEVLASYGHVRDLVPREGAVDPEHHFAMNYDLIERNRKHVDRIIKAAKKASSIYLATDLDREGEAIAWHVQEILDQKGMLDGRDLHRVVFSEITPRAIADAVAHPRGLSQDLVDAQQARRALDYLVGFNLSPLLWKKVQPGLSAGRVQTPALRLIVEREEEIERFVPQEYWTIEAKLAASEQPFTAKLVNHQGERLQQFDLNNAEQAEGLRDRLLAAAGGELTVHRVKKRERRRNPAPPFITSTLQQEASRKLRFSASRTMRLAQQLYEGVDVGDGNRGLITYMRTDSVNLAEDAVKELRQVIEQRYGADSLPEKPQTYNTKSRNAQEAHEAIRPTAAEFTPEQAARYLNADQLKLYELIWKRAVACQMIHATMDTVSVEFDAVEDSTFRASGSTIRIPGFLQVYEESKPAGKEEKEERLPPLEVGDRVTVNAINADQHFTEPPPRYSEASLIKTLEEYSIGRPSTYASIISTLLDREYVLLEKRRFEPTDVGRVVARFLSGHFEQYVDYEFTARLEDELDAISRGEKPWVPVLEEFWTPFIDRVKEKEETVSRSEARQTRLLGEDPKTGKPVTVRLGRYGPYAAIGAGEDDEDKPKFAGLRRGQSMETITLEEALELFKLPRKLGQTEQGEEVSANIGRFGPYVRYGNSFVSLKEDDPYTIELPRALELVEQHRIERAQREIRVFDSGIKVLRGRFGPYITDGNKNAKIPKDREPESLSEEECKELLAAAPERRRRGKKAGKKAAQNTAKKVTKKSSKKKSSKKKTAKKKAAKKKSAKKKAAKK
ncbi:MAG: DNA topoisomerase I [Wenzhouxiangellaceae bacterium]